LPLALGWPLVFALGLGDEDDEESGEEEDLLRLIGRVCITGERRIGVVGKEIEDDGDYYGRVSTHTDGIKGKGHKPEVK